MHTHESQDEATELSEAELKALQRLHHEFETFRETSLYQAAIDWHEGIEEMALEVLRKGKKASKRERKAAQKDIVQVQLWKEFIVYMVDQVTNQRSYDVVEGDTLENQELMSPYAQH